jgi:thiol:disulfide interchange protein DsbD
VIDVFADWCLPCKELDELTFTDEEVKREAERFVTLKLDLTTEDPDTDAGRARKRFAIIGVPTIIFLDATGREDQNLRLTGFENADKFLTRLKRVPAVPAVDVGSMSGANASPIGRSE